MKTFDVVMCILFGTWAVTFAFTGAYTIAHEKGFMRGSESTRIYYETRSSFPSEQWLVENEGSHIRNAYDVIESLESFQEK